MSFSLNKYFQHLKDVECYFRRTCFRMNGDGVDPKDKNLLSLVYTLWVAIVTESITTSLNLPKTWSDTRFISILSRTDVAVLLKTCKEADALLLQSVEVGYPDSYGSFKHCLTRQGFPGEIIGEVKELIAQWFIGYEPSALKTLRTIFLFPTRMNFRSEKLERDALEEYVAHEDNLGGIKLTTAERDVITSWLPRGSIDWSEMVPRHGSGSVADAEGIPTLAWKYRHLETDALLTYVTRYVTDRAHGWEGENLSRRSKLMFVPKTFDSYRTISMEPTALMFWQEGAYHELVRYFSQHRDGFGKRFTPEDQVPSRDLARLGSIDGKYATIDLHAASDSVTLDHVKSWFRDCDAYRWLIATRSIETRLPNGEILPIKKFAPMGSALNFFVETMCFAAITECAIRGAGGNPERSRYRVYGDDIVVEAKYAQAVIDRLTVNGFTVNAAKTFHYGAYGYFREACGGHYLNGCDVTPCIASRHLEVPLNMPIGLWPSRIPSSFVQQLVTLCNQLFDAGYRLSRGYLVQKLLALPQKVRPSFGFGQSEVHSVDATNVHLEQRWNKNLQRLEMRHGVASIPDRHDRDSLVELEEYLRRSELRSRVVDPLTIDAFSKAKKTVWRSVWTEKSCGPLLRPFGTGGETSPDPEWSDLDLLAWLRS